MSDPLIEAVRLLASSEQRAAVIGRNISSAQVPGYRAESLLANPSDTADVFGTERLNFQSVYRAEAGTTQLTGNAFDFAISGEGFFLLQHPETGVEFLSRAGRFHRRSDLQLVDENGLILLSVDGAPVRAASDVVEVLSDGTLLEDGVAVAQIGLFVPEETSAMSAVSGSLMQMENGIGVTRVESGNLLQGAFESSNVELGEEMVELMQSVRQAETGARLIQAYDSMIGSAIATFGRS